MHEPTSPEHQKVESPSQTFANGGSAISAACAAMRITPDVFMVLVDSFNKTFMSFRLFPMSRFWTYLGQIQDEEQAKALLAAIAAFAVKLWEPDESQIALGPLVANLSQSNLIDLAMRSADRSLTNCGDDTPPLHLLQALVLISQWLLIQGVRGRAWRYLGVCIRVAYEMNLHLVDSGRPVDWLDDDANRWIQDEDKRRTWWAIWEMDVFASVIRRCPTAISWLQNETFLPAEDEKWEQKRPQRSCVLEITTMSRCKSLQLTGNQSPRAWFIVINSIMKDAQTISSPMGVDKGAGFDSLDAKSAALYFAAIQTERVEETRKRLTTYYNAVRYFSMALPASLKYRGQSLSFDSSSSAQGQAGIKMLRELHTAIYSIHLMTQLAFLMTLKYHLFKLAANDCIPGQTPGQSQRGGQSTARHIARSQKDIDEYFEAANSILYITNRCNDQFHRYVNPFLVNTIWLAAAVQLLKRELFSADDTERDLVASNFEVLRMNYDMFVEFWRSDDTAKKNLATLQAQLKSFQDKSRNESGTKAGRQPNRQPGTAEQITALKQNGGDAPGHTLQQQAGDAQPGSASAEVNPNAIPESYSINPPMDQQWIPQQGVGAPIEPFNEQTYNFLDTNFFDPFNVPNDFNFNLGTGYNTFDDVFSGSVF